MTEVWNFEKYGTPMKAGGRYFYYHNTGLQNQSVLFATEMLKSEPRVLIDPNKGSEDGTVALAGVALSHHGRYIAYGISMVEVIAYVADHENESGESLDDELYPFQFVVERFARFRSHDPPRPPIASAILHSIGDVPSVIAQRDAGQSNRSILGPLVRVNQNTRLTFERVGRKQHRLVLQSSVVE